jgi:predicted SAM-dependent methyltransferase
MSDEKQKLLILNLGAGNDIVKCWGWCNHDKTWHEGIDVTFDIDEDWSHFFFYDRLFVINAMDVIEHVNDVVHALEQCWESLTTGGYLRIRVPNCLGKQGLENWMTDPTHNHAFTRNSLDYFIRGTELEKKYGFYSSARWKV